MAFREGGITAEETVSFLNLALALDKEAIETLFKTHVLCNENLASHPTIQVYSPALSGGGVGIGILGLLNGMFGANTYGYGCIYMRLDEKNNIVEFFTKYDGGAEPSGFEYVQKALEGKK